MKNPKRRRDLNQWAKHMVDLATCAAQDPKEKPPSSPRAKVTASGNWTVTIAAQGRDRSAE